MLSAGGNNTLPEPGQLPGPVPAVAAAATSAGTGHEHAFLAAPAARIHPTSSLLHGSSSASAIASTYDPGYSPD
ncbi:hypothetical protein GCM10027613_40400 [Microlunatus endophyticus]